MLLKKPIPKLKIKKQSKVKLLDNIIKYEKQNHKELMQIFHHKPQKLHQLYSDHAVIIHNDDEKYNGFFTQMKKYNKIQAKNISEYNKKKEENKNFVKQYTGYKLYNKQVCKDDLGSIYGNLIPLYQKKNYMFSNEFLSGKKIFQESGLLIKNKRHLNEYYKNVEKTLYNKGMRDLNYINHLSIYVEDKLEKSKIKEMEEAMRLMEEVGKVQKNYISDKLEKYKRSKQYKQKIRFEAMKALDEFRKNQIEIENEKKYIENVTNLINLEEKERQKEKELNTTNINQTYNNLESENNNSLFILNRYPNNKYNNKINATKVLPKNRSSINIQSSLYKDATNISINNHNETKKTLLNNRPIKIKKRYSNKTDIDFSEYTIDNNFNDTHENKDSNEYININDEYKNENPLNIHYNIKNSLNNNTTLLFKTRNRTKENISSTKFTKHDELSTLNINDNNKTNNYLLSDFTNISTQKRGRKSYKIPIRNFKSTFNLTKFSDKYKSNSITMINQTSKEQEKKDMKWNYYAYLYKLNNSIHTRNNHKFKHFCENLTTVPKNITDKINKSFELDDKIKMTHLDYVKLLMEQKIMKYYDKDII